MNRRTMTVALSLLLVALASACAKDPRGIYAAQMEPISSSETAFGGEALAQRKLELVRALSDMQNFHKTLESMADRRDREGIDQLRGFVDQYMVVHLDPLLAPPWQSSHPELIVYDATLRCLQADVLIKLGYSRWVSDVLDEMVDRYDEHSNMLVDYPAGTQTTLVDALAMLRLKKWNS